MELQQHDQPKQAEDHQPDPSRLERHRPTRERSCSGARDLAVEIAVDDVVVDAPRPAHHDAAEQQPQDQIEVRDRAARQRDAPRAGPKQQPPPDRPVEPRKQGERARRRREQADEAAMLGIRGEIGRGHGSAPCTSARAGDSPYRRDRSTSSGTTAIAECRCAGRVSKGGQRGSSLRRDRTVLRGVAVGAGARRRGDGGVGFAGGCGFRGYRGGGAQGLAAAVILPLCSCAGRSPGYKGRLLQP